MGAPAGGGTQQRQLPPGGGTPVPASASLFETPQPQLAQQAGGGPPLPAPTAPMPGVTPTSFSGQPLPGQVQNAYTGALNQFGNVASMGNQLLQGSQPYVSQAGGIFGAMPQLAGMDLSPYMNPFTQQVIDRSMGELNRQEGIQQQGIDDATQRQNAFGGDRMYLQKGVLGGEFGRNKGNLIADLNMKNFLNAQQMGQFDIGNKFQSAQGLGTLGLGAMGTGGQLATAGAGGMGDLAAGGFQMANAANASQVGAATAQQQQMQQAIDAANANYARLLGIPQEYLQSMQGISSGLGNFGTTKTNQQQNPGLISQIGAGAGILGAIAGIPIG